MNRKPLNPNYARRLPANCCLICGDQLGNFHPTLANHAMHHWQTDKLIGWGCPDCCADDPPPDSEDRKVRSKQ